MEGPAEGPACGIRLDALRRRASAPDSPSFWPCIGDRRTMGEGLRRNRTAPGWSEVSRLRGKLVRVAWSEHWRSHCTEGHQVSGEDVPLRYDVIRGQDCDDAVKERSNDLVKLAFDLGDFRALLMGESVQVFCKGEIDFRWEFRISGSR
jgi:hypothetical protein